MKRLRDCYKGIYANKRARDNQAAKNARQKNL
jgi:hypothetical protein